MDIAINIIVGNAISLVAGIFIILSMWVNDEKKAYRYQFWNAFILMIASVFFFHGQASSPWPLPLQEMPWYITTS